MTSTDPASLQNLNDIVMPGDVAWWPPAAGWYVLASVTVLMLGWAGYKWMRNRRANRYRRHALLELRALASCIQIPDQRDSSLRRIPILLKRIALSVYPRERVAGLSGESWRRFLNATAAVSPFTPQTFQTLERISYSTGDLADIDAKATHELIDACEQWVRRHRPTDGRKPAGGA